MQNAHIISFLKTFPFNPNCKKILDELKNLEKLNNNKDELDKFVKDKNNETYKVVLYKNDVSCLIQQIKEELTISENVYKLLIDGQSEDNSICFIVYLNLSIKYYFIIQFFF